MWQKIVPGIALLVVLSISIAGCEKPQEQSGTQGQSPFNKLPVAEVGKPAPDFILQDTSGKTWKLSDLKGQVVFINFWATWCPPCREEMPSMQELYGAMPMERFKMLTILSNDDPELAKTFVAKFGYTFPVLIDPFSETGQAYGLTGVPETYIVDKQGVLRQKYIGPRLWSSAQARKLLLSYMNQ
jgi:cytochrome c biogenesis protein CcmG/thiol:disulfide interchange protein DsbE